MSLPVVKRGYNNTLLRPLMSSPVVIHTDGACKGNPGPGGWAAILSWRGEEREISGGAADTTNNRMEMTAVIRALQELKGKNYAVHIYTDSRYVAQGMQEWLPNWRRRGFRKKDGKPVKNDDLWREMDALAAQHNIHWFWLRGHDGHPGNERADMLASRAAVIEKEGMA